VCLARARASINKDAVEERNAGEVAIDDGAFWVFGAGKLNSCWESRQYFSLFWLFKNSFYW